MSYISSLKPSQEKPSKVTKDKLTQLLQQEVTECGRLAKTVCQHSGSREVLMKSAKKMASQEVAMENTLSNLRQIDKLLDRAMDQANNTGRKMEETTVIQDQMLSLTRLH